MTHFYIPIIIYRIKKYFPLRMKRQQKIMNLLENHECHQNSPINFVDPKFMIRTKNDSEPASKLLEWQSYVIGHLIKWDWFHSVNFVHPTINQIVIVIVWTVAVSTVIYFLHSDAYCRFCPGVVASSFSHSHFLDNQRSTLYFLRH